MSYKVVEQSITEAKADIIVNASNGIGYMGGWLGKRRLLKGVAEAIHYKTQGSVEKEARRAARKISWLPSIFLGHKPGEIFMTGAGNLKAKYILHAVTMARPGGESDLDTISELIPKIIFAALDLKANSIAIPLLGTGTGGLDKEEVLEIYNEFFSTLTHIDVTVYIKGNEPK